MSNCWLIERQESALNPKFPSVSWLLLCEFTNNEFYFLNTEHFKLRYKYVAFLCFEDYIVVTTEKSPIPSSSPKITSLVRFSHYIFSFSFILAISRPGEELFVMDSIPQETEGYIMNKEITCFFIVIFLLSNM